MKNKRLLIIISAIAVILLIPLVAMQFSTEVNWSLSDFVIAGILLLATGLSIEFTLRKVKSSGNRLIFCGIIIAILLLIWAELAVGVFGTAFAGT